MNTKEKKKAKKMIKFYSYLLYFLIPYIIVLFIMGLTSNNVYVVTVSIILLISLFFSFMFLFSKLIFYRDKIMKYFEYINKWRNYNAYLHCIKLIKNDEYDKAISLAKKNLWMYNKLRFFIIGYSCKNNPDLFFEIINQIGEDYNPGGFKF